MSLLEKNLRAVEHRDPALARRIRDTPNDPRYTPVSGGLEVRFPNGERLHFFDRRGGGNLARIAERNLFSFSEVIVVVGLGMGNALTDVLASSDRTAFVLLVEADPAFVRAVMQVKDMAGLLEDPRVTLSIGRPPVEAVMMRLEEEFTVFTRPNFQVVWENGSERVHPRYYREIEEMLEKQRTMAENNLRSITRLSALWHRNIFQNLPHLFNNRGIGTLFNDFKGVPALIVAAGPSLDKNCRWIQAARRSMVVIAVDTALKTLLRNGVRPHFVVSLDALLDNWAHMDGVDTDGMTLVVNPVTYPKIPAAHRGRMLITDYSEPLVQWLEARLGEFGTNLTGGSVATSAFDFACRLGCSPVILSGQDLAFTGNRTHTSGTARDDLLYTDIGIASTYDEKHGQALDMEVKETGGGVMGHNVATSKKMASWRNWFEIQIAGRNIDCINATEGGSVIKGTRPLTLQEAVTCYGTASVDVDAALQKYRSTPSASNIQKVVDDLAALSGRTAGLKKVCSLGLREAQKAQALARQDPAEGEEALDRSLYHLQKVMAEKDFMDIQHWRLEATMDRIQRIQSSIKSSDPGKRLYVNAEAFVIFFRETYALVREFEKNLRQLPAILEQQPREVSGAHAL